MSFITILTNFTTRRRHVATKTFLALRIFVNDEMTQLFEGIQCASRLLRSGGKLSLLTYQSAEHKVSLRALRKQADVVSSRDHASKDKKFPEQKVWKEVRREEPGEEEIKGNPRSRSAVLRVATKS